jgi:uncharacterized protein YerC
MREISLTSKYKVVKLFLTGLSYDEISHQVGIAKGQWLTLSASLGKGIYKYRQT